MEGQLNISNFGDTLEVRLRNFPEPYKTEMQGGHPVSYWKHKDESELQDKPPIYKETTEDEGEEIKLVKRKDNDTICGFDIPNWQSHRDFMHYRLESDACECGENEMCDKCGDIEVKDHTKLDAPRM